MQIRFSNCLYTSNVRDLRSFLIQFGSILKLRVHLDFILWMMCFFSQHSFLNHTVVYVKGRIMTSQGDTILLNNDVSDF